MRIFVGLTDEGWFNKLRSIKPEEVNYWQPRSLDYFRALSPGELFLFKLHSPKNYIVGGGLFIRQVHLPISLVWEAFGEKNGVNTFKDLCDTLLRYQEDKKCDPNRVISSLILAQPFFLDNSQWIPMPTNWARNIVKGKTYRPGEPEHDYLIDAVKGSFNEQEGVDGEQNRFGNPVFVKPRLGQGSFRVIVTEAYKKRCAITDEKTLPVLEAAHIMPYTAQGPHELSNGILLRQDFHTLFDKGFITITTDRHIEVSKKIKEIYGNGREYYSFHGKALANMPQAKEDQPGKEYLTWHNEKVFIDSISS